MLAVAVHRVVELAISRRRLQARPAPVVREPATFPLMVVLHCGLVVAPLLEVPLLERRFDPGLAAAAGAALSLAIALRVWTLRVLGPDWNVRVIAPAAVATTGPYAWIRHPNYLVVALEVAALPLLHGAWISALVCSLLNAVVLALRIRAEETLLATQPVWTEAMGDKARLVPGLL